MLTSGDIDNVISTEGGERFWINEKCVGTEIGNLGSTVYYVYLQLNIKRVLKIDQSYALTSNFSKGERDYKDKRFTFSSAAPPITRTTFSRKQKIDNG